LPQRLRSQYSIRLYNWAKKYVSVGTKRISLEQLRKVLGLESVKDADGKVIQEAPLPVWANFRQRALDTAIVERLAPKKISVARLAAICGCNAGLFRDVLHEVYLPQIQRGNASFAANVLGARGALLSVLSHFFAHRHWGLLAETTIEGQSLNEEDQLLVLIQSALCLTATRGMGSPEAQTCCERAEPLCRSLNRPDLLYAALVSQWGYSLFTDRLTPTMQIAKRVYSLAQELKDPMLLMGGCRALACTLYFLGDIETARQYAMSGVKIWRSGNLLSAVEELNEPVVPCLYFLAVCEWYLGKVASSQANIAEAVTLAKELNDSHGLAIALAFAGILA
jgi:hypothetical protein